MAEESRRLLTEPEFAIRALREYIQALPDDVVDNNIRNSNGKAKT